MTIDNKASTEITEADLRALVSNSVSEGSTLDYKRATYGTADKDKKEFLFDVSSFANASGGHIIIGMNEKRGIATDLIGIELDDVDAEILRLENLLLNCIKPRVRNVSITGLQLNNGNISLLIHIPKSYSPPHMVEYSGNIWFYARNSAGKYRLDIDQLRGLILQSESLVDKVRHFRSERVELLLSNGTPVPVSGNSKLVLHVIPLSAFSYVTDVPATMLSTYPDLLVPYGEFALRSETLTRYNLDGFISYVNRFGSTFALGYTQAFRNTIVESVDSYYLNHDEYKQTIMAWDIEGHVIGVLDRTLRLYQQIGVTSPIVILMSLLNVSGYVLPKPNHLIPSPYDAEHPIDRSLVLLPEVMVEDMSGSSSIYMKPAFDAMWNAAGWPYSLNYDQEGNRRQS